MSWSSDLSFGMSSIGVTSLGAQPIEATARTERIVDRMGGRVLPNRARERADLVRARQQAVASVLCWAPARSRARTGSARSRARFGKKLRWVISARAAEGLRS